MCCTCYPNPTSDGTVGLTFVRNAGHTTIMPLCLRPLTLDEELAPPPPSRAARLLRAASHRLRRAIHSRRKRREEAELAANGELEGEHVPPATIPEGEKIS